MKEPIANHDVTRYSWKSGFSTYGKDGFALAESDRFERCWCCPKSLGEGTFRRVKIREGFELWIADCLFMREAYFSFHDSPSLLLFGFYLSGHYEAIVGRRKKMPLEFYGEQQYLMYVNEPDGVGQVKAGMPLRSVSIVISPERLFYYFEDDMALLPSVVRRIVEKKGDEIFLRIKDITPAMHVALRQIVDCPYRGVTRKLFFESRSLELIAYQLKQLSVSEPPPARRSSIMHPGDRNRTEFARNLLLRNLDAPPNLNELAEATGMSHPKLNRCFRQMFGTTVFQYLKHERLQQARFMIEDQGLTVTETAYSVGYSSLSHFAKAYKHHFGISPGADFRRKRAVEK